MMMMKRLYIISLIVMVARAPSYKELLIATYLRLISVATIYIKIGDCNIPIRLYLREPGFVLPEYSHVHIYTRVESETMMWVNISSKERSNK